MNLNRNSERIPTEGPPWRTCGGVSERIKNRYIPYSRRFPVRSAAGSFNFISEYITLIILYVKFQQARFIAGGIPVVLGGFSNISWLA